MYFITRLRLSFNFSFLFSFHLLDTQIITPTIPINNIKTSYTTTQQVRYHRNLFIYFHFHIFTADILFKLCEKKQMSNNFCILSFQIKRKMKNPRIFATLLVSIWSFRLKWKIFRLFKWWCVGGYTILWMIEMVIRLCSRCFFCFPDECWESLMFLVRAWLLKVFFFLL